MKKIELRRLGVTAVLLDLSFVGDDRLLKGKAEGGSSGVAVHPISGRGETVYGGLGNSADAFRFSDESIVPVIEAALADDK